MANDWTISRDLICASALRKLGVISDGATASPTQLNAAAEALNNIVYSLAAQGMPLWAMGTYTYTMTAAKNSYSMFSTGDWPANGNAPLKVVQGWITDNRSNIDVPLNLYTEYNYNLLSDKTQQGRPVHFWFEPLNQSGFMHLWPTPDADTAANCTVSFRLQRPFDYFIDGTSAPDFPQVWLEPLIYSLAHRLAPEYGIPLQERQMLLSEANSLIANALSFGTEEGSWFMQPDWVTYDMGH